MSQHDNEAERQTIYHPHHVAYESLSNARPEWRGRWFVLACRECKPWTQDGQIEKGNEPPLLYPPSQPKPRKSKLDL